MPTSPSAAAGLFAGRYAIEHALGQGATANVHLALDHRTGLRIAIKILRPELAASGAADRFLKEIANTASLKHAGILEVLDSGQHEGQLYFTLPYMEGGTLRQKLKRERQLSLDDAVTIVGTIAEALDYAHARGLVHRDVKPENILFTQGRACLGDFGIARALQTVYGDGTTSSATIRGTPAYMSPEQAAGAEVLDGRSDVFSLACVAYEMVTGMQAFMGPTPESVVAQRFAFTPREIRAYRPAAPTSIDTALARAFTLSPADRYPTAGELARALEAARNVAPKPPITPVPPTRSIRGVIVAASLIAAVVVGAILLNVSETARMWLGITPRSDTTRVAVLPFEDGESLGATDLMGEGLRRYRVTIVESFATADAVRQRGAIASMEDARAVATALGAGRVIRGRVGHTASGRTVYAALYDVGSDRELYHAVVPLPSDSGGVLSAFASLADSLLLRGSREGAPAGGHSVSLPAIQAFLAGRRALNEWDLQGADALFSHAIELDPAGGRARLWLAQVRSWKGDPPLAWKATALGALEDTLSLSLDERAQADALGALAIEDFPRACTLYRGLIDRRPRDFGAWYGLGECHRRDRLVLADSTSPSGWRFRSSYYQGMLAYQRAFEVFPTSYRGFQSDAFQPLQQLLFASHWRLRPGATATSPQRFFAAWAVASGDTILFTPFPREAVQSGTVRPDSGAVSRAVLRSRRVFQSIASAWSAALPRSAGTKEALAISLELTGDLDAAVDSLRVARTLATDSSHRLRLAAHEVMLDVKLVVARGVPALQRARILADSILRATSPRNATDAELLTQLAVLLGRCSQATTLVRLTARPVQSLAVIPPGVLAAAYDQLPGVALGCTPSTALQSVSDRFNALAVPEADRTRAEHSIIGSLVRLNFPDNPGIIRRLARATADFVLVAEDSLLSGNVAGAKRQLAQILAARATSVTAEFPPDAALAEARLWLAVSDTAVAVMLIDRSIETLPMSPPMSTNAVSESIVRLASIGRLMVLRAEIAAAQGKPSERWSELVAELWKSGEPALQARVQRLSQGSHR